jgi:hypothetical protein
MAAERNCGRSELTWAGCLAQILSASFTLPAGRVHWVDPDAIVGRLVATFCIAALSGKAHASHVRMHSGFVTDKRSADGPLAAGVNVPATSALQT